LPFAQTRTWHHDTSSRGDLHAYRRYPHACEDCPLQPGDRIELRPSHIDPTINLHDVLYAVDGDAVVDVWPVAARGYAEQRAARE